VIEAGVDADVLEAFPATLWLEAKDVPRLQGTAHASSHLDLG
jgi:hypothetical protein